LKSSELIRVGCRGAIKMRDDAEMRGKLIRQLEDALALTEELNDPMTGYLIERALDEARAQQFRPPT
jgi:hypothetical protein